MNEGHVTMLAKLIGVAVLYLFIPLSALTYYFFRRQRRTAEVERAFAVLNIDLGYRQVYREETVGSYTLWAVAYASLVSCIGLTLLFLGSDIGLAELPSVPLGSMEFPRQGSRLVLGMAFLGAYLWGLQYIFRRYSLTDLTPSVYYDLSMRMIFAAITALVIYNAFEALAGGSEPQGEAAASGGISLSIWPVLAFFIGMFPQRGLRWLSDRLPIFSPGTTSATRPAPLELIEGIELHDTLRLEELGIDTCYDLATADFVPLVLKTPYSARQLIDWILQAKLCVYFGETVKDLRQHGIRAIIDLEPLTDEDIVALSAESSATKSALERARESVRDNLEIRRLRLAGELLGRFWHDEDNPPPAIDMRP
jgi:hypothetical protein